jgi:hypothetical protein
MYVNVVEQLCRFEKHFAKIFLHSVPLRLVALVKSLESVSGFRQIAESATDLTGYFGELQLSLTGKGRSTPTASETLTATPTSSMTPTATPVTTTASHEEPGSSEDERLPTPRQRAAR